MRIRIYVNVGHFDSPYTSLPFVSGFEERYWIDVEKIRGGFRVVDTNITSRNGPWITGTSLCFADWDNDVKNLTSPDHDFLRYCGVSSMHLRWKKVDLKPWKIKARSTKQLLQALARVSFKSFDPDDV